MTEKKNRTIHYSFKATPEEDAIIQRKMKTFGIKNQSAFIRAMALNGYVLKLDLPELHDAVRLMGSLSNNVNQIARRLNEHGSVFETEIDDITFLLFGNIQDSKAAATHAGCMRFHDPQTKRCSNSSIKRISALFQYLQSGLCR